MKCTKLIFGYLVLILLMGGVAVVAYWGMGRIMEAEDLALERETNAADLWVMNKHMIDQYAHQADLIINDDPSAIDDFRDAVEAMDTLKDKVRQAVDTDAERGWMAEIDQIDKEFDDLFFEQIVPAVEAGDQELLVTLDDQSDALLDQMEDIVAKLVASFKEEVDVARDEATAASR